MLACVGPFCEYVMSESLNFENASKALREALDELQLDGVTLGTYEISTMFCKQVLGTIEKGLFQEFLLKVGLTAQFHSREHIVVQRTYENTRYQRFMTTEFEAAVRRARTDQTALGRVDSGTSDAVD